MLYYLFDYLDQLNFPGAGVFHYISFRAALAIIVSLLISLIFGGKIIRLLHRLQVGETVRDLGLDGQKEKQGTPTMGGLIIIAAITIPTLLFAKLDNIYVVLMLFVTISLGLVGFFLGGGGGFKTPVTKSKHCIFLCVCSFVFSFVFSLVFSSMFPSGVFLNVFFSVSTHCFS